MGAYKFNKNGTRACLLGHFENLEIFGKYGFLSAETLADLDIKTWKLMEFYFNYKTSRLSRVELKSISYQSQCINTWNIVVYNRNTRMALF